MTNTAFQGHKISRTADSSALYSITWVQSQLNGSQKFSKNTRSYLWFLLALVKRGYVQIAATQREIADSYYRASGGNKSVRSLQYALSDLENAGFISRRKYRIGDDHFRSVILIHREAFAFWTRETTKTVAPLPTSSHVSSYAQNVRKDPVTEISRCNPTISSNNKDKMLRAGARSKTRASTFKFHPILFSVMSVLFGHMRFWPKKFPPTVQLAESEIRGDRELTGIRWKRWAAEWQKMPIDEREGICRTSFLPRLESNVKAFLSSPPPKQASLPPPKRAISPPPKRAISPPKKRAISPAPVLATQGEISSMLAAARFYSPPPEEEPESRPSTVSLDPKELEYLSGLKKLVAERG